jgi:hypothetical protein
MQPVEQKAIPSGVIVQAGEDGVMVSAQVLREAGIEPGQIVEVVALPGPEQIQRLALRHCVWKLGDAIRVAWPQLAGDAWRVNLLSHDGGEQIGTLYYDPHGELIPGKSTTRETLR